MIIVVNDMKKVLKFFRGLIIFVWAIVAVTTTVCLINYNDYNITEIGNTSVIIMDNNELEPTYKKNDVVLIKKDKQEDYKVGDTVFFYTNNKTVEDYISCATIDEVVDDYEAEYSYTIDGVRIGYSDIIGKADGSAVYHKVGGVLSVFESQWGFMFLIILPTLFLLVYEIYSIVMEVKKEIKEETKAEAKEAERKKAEREVLKEELRKELEEENKNKDKDKEKD